MSPLLSSPLLPSLVQQLDRKKKEGTYKTKKQKEQEARAEAAKAAMVAAGLEGKYCRKCKCCCVADAVACVLGVDASVSAFY